MPLIKSKSDKAFSKNVETEMKSGKPQDQSLAIAYSVKRKAKKKMAEGGRAFDFKHRANNEEGIHPVFSKAKPGMSGMGADVRDIKHQRAHHGGESDPERHEEIQAEHKRVMQGMSKIQPKLKGLYDGGMVDVNDQDQINHNRGNKSPHNDGWLDRSTVAQAQSNNGRMVKPIKRPKMVPSNAFSTRMYDEEADLQASASPGPYGSEPPRHDDEEGADRQGPQVRDMQDEHSTHRKPYAEGGKISNDHLATDNHALSDYRSKHSHLTKEQHAAKAKEVRAGAEGMSDRYKKNMETLANYHDSQSRESYAKGGQVESSDYSARPNKYMDDLLDIPPSEDEGAMYADEHDEMGQNRQGPRVPDMEREHNNGRMPYAEGGEVHSGAYHAELGKIRQSEKAARETGASKRSGELHTPEQERALRQKHYGDRMKLARGGEVSPQDEIDMDHEDSIAAAIMARKERQMHLDSDSDIDRMVMMARGGEILEDSPDIHSHGSMDTHEDADQVDLSRNADEDANEEDQASFDALRKENYSESDGLRKLDQPRDSNLKGDDEESESENKRDRVSRIMSKMNAKRQFKQR